MAASYAVHEWVHEYPNKPVEKLVSIAKPASVSSL